MIQHCSTYALLRLGVQFGERRLGLGDDRRVAFRLAQFDQFDSVGDLALDAAVAGDRVIEPSALAQQFLRRGRVVPQLGVFGV